MQEEFGINKHAVMLRTPGEILFNTHSCFVNDSKYAIRFVHEPHYCSSSNKLFAIQDEDPG